MPTNQAQVDRRANYLMVLPVPFHRLDARRCAIESAFAGHLRLLLASLRPHVETLTIASPEMDAEGYARV